MQNLPSQPVAGNSNLVSGSLNKEQEPIVKGLNEIQEVGTGETLPKEVEKAGVVMRQDHVEVPPDMQQIGVQSVQPTQTMGIAQTIQLPLTDDQILTGLNAQILSSFRWLAEWCVRKLKQAHLHLKKMGGKVMREES